jgi:type IV pilus assembly protein PilN
MIRINLLPVREAKRQAGLRKQGVLIGAAAGGGVAVCVLLHLMVAGQIAAEQRRIQEATVQLKQLEETRAEVEKFREEEKEIERKLGVIQKLERDRTGQVLALAQISDVIPKRMWLTNLTVKGADVSMKGISLDAEIVAEFLTKLESSPMFEDVELDETTLEEAYGLKLNAFKIRSKYGYNPETPAVPATTLAPVPAPAPSSASEGVPAAPAEPSHE